MNTDVLYQQVHTYGQSSIGTTFRPETLEEYKVINSSDEIFRNQNLIELEVRRLYNWRWKYRVLALPINKKLIPTVQKNVIEMSIIAEMHKWLYCELYKYTCKKIDRQLQLNRCDEAQLLSTSHHSDASSVTHRGRIVHSQRTFPFSLPLTVSYDTIRCCTYSKFLRKTYSWIVTLPSSNDNTVMTLRREGGRDRIEHKAALIVQ